MRSRDVIHSFWIVDFLYKKDVFPGGTIDRIFFTPQRLGTFEGKCAELCGEYHSAMLFQVKVVTQDEFNAYTTKLHRRWFPRKHSLRQSSTETSRATTTLNLHPQQLL
jgi:cytochrome c oxidase subunit 2